jgi:hypothetical protein
MRVESTRMHVASTHLRAYLVFVLLLLFLLITCMRVDLTRTRVDSTRIVLFSVSRRRVKSTRTVVLESYCVACRIDTQIFTVYSLRNSHEDCEKFRQNSV